MEKHSLRPLVILTALFAGTILLLVLAGRLPPQGDAAVRATLPPAVGEWRGRQVLHCQNEQCAIAVLAAEGETPLHCEVCGAAMAGLSVGEANLLPSDTDVVRTQYMHPSGRSLTASVVLMGADRTAIHNPMVCLKAQGYRVSRQRIVAASIEGRPPLDLALLDLERASYSPDGVAEQGYAAYGYWFVAKGRETSSRLAMFFWMGMDRLFRNRADRWAYISIVAPRRDATEDSLDTVSSFVSALYPLLTFEK